MATDTAVLLDLLREAGEEAVTLDELAVAGVRDPARALHALEEAGHAVQRVHDNRFTCVRLAPPGERLPAPRATTVADRPRIPAAGVLGGIALLAVVAAGARRSAR
ncbi:MAG: hypothetical protein QOD81_559 [Solirubrobacteraceae bacterium]|jgi:hypothetical protein|nr:hypothetical protein [Solirubrobacteraceae bacterium]